MKLLKLFALFSLILLSFETILAIRTYRFKVNEEKNEKNESNKIQNEKNEANKVQNEINEINKEKNQINQAQVQIICKHYTDTKISVQKEVGEEDFYFSLCFGSIDPEKQNELEKCTSYTNANGDNAILTYINKYHYDFSHLTIVPTTFFGFKIACVGKDQVKDNVNKMAAKLTAKDVAELTKDKENALKQYKDNEKGDLAEHYEEIALASTIALERLPKLIPHLDWEFKTFNKIFSQQPTKIDSSTPPENLKPNKDLRKKRFRRKLKI
jgi:small-conductance mechanosensitive channel